MRGRGQRAPCARLGPKPLPEEKNVMIFFCFFVLFSMKIDMGALREERREDVLVAT
jgi:hypothetical protein